MKLLKVDLGYVIEHERKNCIRLTNGSWIEEQKITENCISLSDSENL